MRIWTSNGVPLSLITEVYQEFETIQDLYRLDPASGAVERLTRGLRASEPDVAADGAIAFSQRLPGGGTAISVLSPDGKMAIVQKGGAFENYGSRLIRFHRREDPAELKLLSGGWTKMQRH